MFCLKDMVSVFFSRVLRIGFVLDWGQSYLINQWRKGDHQEAARVLELQFSLKALSSTRVTSLVAVGNWSTSLISDMLNLVIRNWVQTRNPSEILQVSSTSSVFLGSPLVLSFTFCFFIFLQVMFTLKANLICSTDFMINVSVMM